MDEQLSLEGLLGALKKEQIKTRSKKRATASKTADDGAIQERINALVQGTTEIKVMQSAPVDTPPVPVDEQKPSVITVSELNKSIRGMLEKSFSFLWVKGEISNLKIPGSGHLYFTLKDSGGQVRAIMFRGFAQGLKFKPTDGMEVLVRCRVTVYEPRGDYQLFCEVMEPVGFGALQVAFEKLKEQLQKEGLFEIARKKQIPAFPTRIAIITSPTGAAIKDMLNVLGRRFGGGLDITILPSSVQGDKAPGEIAAAVNLVHKMGTVRFDVLIVGRGGGSLEDLWAFNTEEVARAVSSCCVPTISAVGHEVDFSICDFVADLRAPTPSAAAELVVKNKADLMERLRLLSVQLLQQTRKRIQLLQSQALGLSKRLVDPKRKLQDLMLRCDEWTERLTAMMLRFLNDHEVGIKLLVERIGTPEKHLQLATQRLVSQEERLVLSINKQLQVKEQGFKSLAALLNGLSPLGILDRGYSIVKKGEIIIKNLDQVKTGDDVQIRLSSGELSARIL